MKKKIKKFEEINERWSSSKDTNSVIEKTITKKELLNLLQDNLKLSIKEKGETIEVGIYFDGEFISSDEFSILGYL